MAHGWVPVLDSMENSSMWRGLEYSENNSLNCFVLQICILCEMNGSYF